MKKSKILISLIVCFSGAFIFAQESENVEEISLPDVSTVISGGAPKVGKSAVSDFSDVLPSSDSEIVMELPTLPDSSDSTSSEKDEIFKASSEKTIYVEGLAGGGFPGFITGNFKIYRETGNSPFVVDFGHEGANGYSGRDLTSSYSDRNTHIAFDKMFKVNKTKLDFKGHFNSEENGLQNKNETISGVTHETLGGSFNFIQMFSDETELGFNASGDWYKRYATVVGTSDIADYALDVGLLYLEPELYFLWNHKGFSLKTLFCYDFEYDLKNSLDGGSAANRGDFSILLGWKNDIVNIYGSAGVIVSNYIGDNSVIIPFSAGIDFGFNSSLSSRKIKIDLKGGLDSYRPKIIDFEKRYGFTSASYLAQETSDWFGLCSVLLPIKDRFTLNLNAEFKKSAFENGTVMADYDKKADLNKLFGQYVFIQEELTQFNTNADFSVRLGYFNFSAGWKAFWIDKPSDFGNHFASASFSFQEPKSKFGFKGSAGVSFDSEDDNTPKVDFETFFRLTPAVRLAVSLDDVVKLITDDERKVCGDYISRSGTASVLVKFFF